VGRAHHPTFPGARVIRWIAGPRRSPQRPHPAERDAHPGGGHASLVPDRPEESTVPTSRGGPGDARSGGRLGDDKRQRGRAPGPRGDPEAALRGIDVPFDTRNVRRGGKSVHARPGTQVPHGVPLRQ
jgi:hypothetical protein